MWHTGWVEQGLEWIYGDCRCGTSTTEYPRSGESCPLSSTEGGLVIRDVNCLTDTVSLTLSYSTVNISAPSILQEDVNETLV